MSARLTVLCLALALALTLCGCGGDGGGQGGRMGALHFSVKFPPLPAGEIVPQYIPSYTQSLVITVTDKATGLPKCDPIIVNRPDNSQTVVNVTIPDLNTGLTKILVQGHIGADGQQEIICDAVTEVEVLPNQTLDVNMTMGVTVYSISVYGPYYLLTGLTGPFTATAWDVDGNLVLDAELVWSSDDETIATVDQTGLATAVARGSTRIRCTNPRAGVDDSSALAVYPYIDKVEFELVGAPYLPAQVHPAAGTTATTIPQGQSLDVVVKCYGRGEEVTGVPISFLSDYPETVSVVQDAPGSPNATLQGLQVSEGAVTIHAYPDYALATGALDVTVTYGYGPYY